MTCNPRNSLRSLARSWCCAFAVGLLFFLGCSKSGPVCYPVQGTVLLDCKPLAEAMIVLHPVGREMEGKQKPLGYSDQSGHFELTTWQSGDGAPPGVYSITVELRALRRVGEEMIRDGRNLIPDRYAKPQASQFRCEITEGTNELPPLSLSSRY